MNIYFLVAPSDIILHCIQSRGCLASRQRRSSTTMVGRHICIIVEPGPEHLCCYICEIFEESSLVFYTERSVSVTPLSVGQQQE